MHSVAIFWPWILNQSHSHCHRRTCAFLPLHFILISPTEEVNVILHVADRQTINTKRAGMLHQFERSRPYTGRSAKTPSLPSSQWLTSCCSQFWQEEVDESKFLLTADRNTETSYPVSRTQLWWFRYSRARNSQHVFRYVLVARQWNEWASFLFLSG